MSDDRFTNEPTRPHSTAYWAKQARTAITQARANLCPCGVKRTHCVNHRDEEMA